MGITRRSLLQLMFGAAAGTVVSPLPWKLVDDVGIWTQNWFLTPKLIRGEISFKHTVCGLCGGGCGVRVRMLDDVPIAVADQDGHPLSHGGVCPLGLAAMQMRFHPSRIAKPVVKGQGGQFEAATPTRALEIVGERIAKAKAGEGAAAVLDMRPGSAMSALYLEFLGAVGGGHYITELDDGSAARAFGGMTENGPARFGYDFENAKAVMSFGAPLLEGWGGTGRMSGVKRVWNAKGNADKPRLVYAGSNHSITASMADKWLPLQPGTEGALALGIANAMLKEKMVDEAAVSGRAVDFEGYKALVEKFPVQKVAELTGLSAGDIVSAARMLAKETPSIAVGGGDAGAGPLGRGEEMAIAGLNLLTGAFGKAGGAVALGQWPPLPKPAAQPAPEPTAQEPTAQEPTAQDRPAQEQPAAAAAAVPAIAAAQRDPAPVAQPVETRPKRTPAKTFDEIEDGSIALLIVDGSMPFSALPRQLVHKKLASGAMTVSLFPYLAGANLDADVILPSASIGEWEYDVPTPRGAARNSYSIAAKLTEAPPGMVAPPELLALMAKAGGVEISNNKFQKTVDENLGAILASGRGGVYEPKTGKTKGVDKYSSMEKLKRALVDGGCWVDDLQVADDQAKFFLAGAPKESQRNLEALAKGRAAELSGDEGGFPLMLMPFGRPGESAGTALPQVMAKLYRETNLRSSASCARINPDTGARLGLPDKCSAELATPMGAMTVKVAYDGSVRPGAVRVAVAPSSHSFGDSQERGQSVLDVVELGADSRWRLTRASLKEVRHA